MEKDAEKRNEGSEKREERPEEQKQDTEKKMERPEEQKQASERKKDRPEEKKEDPQKKKEGMIRDFLSRWGRVAGQPEEHEKKLPEGASAEEEEVSACSVCGAEVHPESTICPACGASFEEALQKPPIEEKGAEVAPGETEPVRLAERPKAEEVAPEAEGGLPPYAPPPEPPELKGAPPTEAVPPPEPLKPTRMETSVPEPEEPGGLRKIVMPAPPIPSETPAKAPVAFTCPVCGTGIEGGVEKCAVCGATIPAAEELEAARRKMAETIAGTERPAVQKKAARVPEGERRCAVCRAPLAPAAEVCLVCGTPVEEKGVRRLARPFEPEIDQETPMELPAPQEMTGEELEIPKTENDWQGWLVQGDIYYNAGRVQKALEAYDTSLRIKESYEAYNNKGLVLYREGLFEEALKCFDKALSVNDKDEFIWFNKGNNLRDMGRFQECLEAYDRAISLRPDFEKAWAATGQALMAQGKVQEAMTCFESALRINWDNEHTWHAIGSAMFKLGRLEEAETALEKSVQLRHDYWEGWYDLAELRIEVGKLNEAAEALLKVTEHNPRHWRSWLECGGLLSDLGQEKKALALFARAAELNPGSWETWRALGHEYFSLKRYDEAAQSFTRATKLNPSDAPLWLEAAESFYLTGQPGAALEAVERSLRIKETPEGWLSKGISYATLGATAEAVSCFEKGLALDNGSPRLWYEKATAQRLLGDLQGALASYDKALGLNPKYEKALSDMGRLLMEMGRAKEALDYLDNAVAVRPSLDKLENIAHLRQMLILAEASRAEEKPLPAVAKLTPEVAAKMGLEVGVSAALLMPAAPPAAGLQPTAPGAPPSAVVAPSAVTVTPLPAAVTQAPVPAAPEAVQLPAAPAPALAAKPPSAAAVPAEAAAAAPSVAVPEVTPEMVPEGAVAELEEPGALEAVPVPESEPEEAPPAARAKGPPVFEEVPGAPRRAAEAALAEFEIVEAARTGAQRAGLVVSRGLVNGRGMVKGEGMVNGRGAVNGMGLLSGRGLVNGRGQVNGRGRGKGEGFINGRGVINGRSLINGNGVVNGRGFTNGMPFGEGREYSALARRMKRRQSAGIMGALAVFVAIMLIIPYLAVQLEVQRGIRVDGDFADWDGLVRYSDRFDDQPSEPSINMLNYSVSREQGSVYFLVQTAGRLLEGASEGVDEIRMFIDTDASAATGYRFFGIGADRMIGVWGYSNQPRGAELYTFNASRSQQDWNGWDMAGSARAAVGGSSLEAGATLGELGIGEQGMFIVSFHLVDGKGNSDTSDLLISNQRGAMAAVQSGLVPLEISNLSAPLPLLSVDLTTVGGDLLLSRLKLEALGATSDRPTGLSGVSLYIDSDRSGAIESGDVLLATAAPQDGAFDLTFASPLECRRASLLGLLAMGTLRPDAPPGSPVGVRLASREAISVIGAATLSGAGRLGFVISRLPEITIDGSFEDWDALPLVNDTNSTVNPDIDILHHAVASDREALSFYLDVEGRMLGGAGVPATARARPVKPSEPGPIEPTPPAAPLPRPVVTGEDTAAVFIDSDRNASTGLAAGGIGADYSVQVSGKEGNVLASAVYRADADGNWSLLGAVPAGIDERRLETQVSFAALAIDPVAVDAVMYATDWSGARDYSLEARGRGGELDLTAKGTAPAVATAGTTWAMLSLTLTAAGGPVRLYALELRPQGNAQPEDAPRSYLFLDMDASGDLSGLDMLLPGSEGNLTGGIYRCAPFEPLLVPEGGTRVLFIAVEVSGGAVSGRSFGIELAGKDSVSSSALTAYGNFPFSSGICTLGQGGGRSWDGEAPTEGLLRVALVEKMEGTDTGDFDPEGGTEGRAPSGGWPTSWTILSNDSNNPGWDFRDIDIFNISATDNSQYLYFKMGLQDLATLYVNDEWNFYFKTNDSTDNNYDMWYRVTLRVTNANTPTFNSYLSSYTGNNNPPDRGDFTSVNESHSGTGNSTDGTAYGYYFDRANDTIYFYVVKSQLYGNLLAPGNSSLVYADTWYVNNRGRWRNYDKQPGNPKSYTMVPEFSDILAPLAGTVLLFALIKRRAASWRRSVRRAPGRGPKAAGGRQGGPAAVRSLCVRNGGTVSR